MYLDTENEIIILKCDIQLSTAYKVNRLRKNKNFLKKFVSL